MVRLGREGQGHTNKILAVFDKLSDEKRRRIGDMFIEDVLDGLRQGAKSVLQADTSIGRAGSINHMEMTVQSCRSAGFIFGGWSWI